MDIGARCSQCRGSRFIEDQACDVCQGWGVNNWQTPIAGEYVQAGPDAQVSAAAIYAEADARQFADDAIAADREKYGRWISGRLVMPRWINGQPSYELHD